MIEYSRAISSEYTGVYVSLYRRCYPQSQSLSKTRKHDRRTAYLDEVRQHTRPAPAWITQGFPCIVVISPAAIPTHSIEDATATQHLSLRHRTGGSIKLCLGSGRKVPIVYTANVCSDIYWVLDNSLIMIPELKSTELHIRREGGLRNACFNA